MYYKNDINKLMERIEYLKHEFIKLTPEEIIKFNNTFSTYKKYNFNNFYFKCINCDIKFIAHIYNYDKSFNEFSLINNKLLLTDKYLLYCDEIIIEDIIK